MSAAAPDALAPLLGRIVPVRRDEMAVQFGADRLQWLFTAVFATMVALVPVFGWLAARLPVDRLLPVLYGFFALNLVGFYAALQSGVPLRALAAAHDDVAKALDKR